MQISKRSELPTSFAIEKYNYVKDFDIEDWVVNLEQRSICAFAINLDHDSYPAGKEKSKFRADEILECPLYSSENFEKMSGLTKNTDSSLVGDLKVWQYFMGKADYEDDDRYGKYCRAYDRWRNSGFAVDQEDSALIDSPLWKMYESCGIDDDGDVALSVNLHGSEEQLVADFRKWLNGIKRARGLDMPIKRRDFQSWTQHCILPFLDLTNWARAYNKEITQQVLGLALFPAEFEVNLGERVRKVVSPLAQRVSATEFINSLRSQALSMRAEQ